MYIHIMCIHIYIYMYIQGPALTSRKRVTGVFVHGASRHGTMASQPVTAHHGTSQISRSQSRRITERSPSRTVMGRMHVNVVRVYHAVSHHCQVETGCQTKTFQRSASQRITAHHEESRSITEITEHHVHQGVRHGASRSGPHHGRSQHG